VLPYQIWLKSVKMRPKYGDFSIFQYGDCRHLRFFKFHIFNRRTAQEGRMRRRAKFGQNRSNRGGDMAIFRLFNMAAAAILDFQNFKLLTVGQLKRVVHCCQTVGRIKMKLGMQAGLVPGHIVLDGIPAPPPQRGTAPT